MRKRIAVFASGSGSNFQALLDNEIGADIVLLVSDKVGARCITRAEQSGVATFVFSAKEYASKKDFETEIVQQLQTLQVDLVLLAGYMRLIGDVLLASYGGRIINLHPSLLPAFPGKDAIGQAYEKGVKVTGVTVHYVDEGMDTGPIIAQEVCRIDQDMTIEQLTEKIHLIEHQLYPTVVSNLVKEL
ncbi:MAG: phosphoribosylglycinamide formyltransferase [Bacilli bacterium]